ncbi:TPA: DEAD/DEAH box helicase, partial [Candidatus Bipolaricaulota bacterium]|nr:DEAD/DEAH box helicase [Candidatus Bipolaricaulota bacterium]
ERAEAYIYAEHYEGIIYEIETQGGPRVALSPDHPLLVETDAGYVWKPVREIRVGDRIGAPKRINLPEVEIHFDPTQALQRLQDAEVLVTRRDFDRLESKTASFKNFSRLYPQELRNLLAIVGVTYPRLAEAIGVRSIATIHRLIYGKTDYKRRELERFLQDRLRGAKFEANRVVVQTGNSVHRFTYPRRVDQRLVEWVAFLLAEGHIHSGRDGAFLSVSQKRRPELLINFLRATEELFQLRFQRKGKIDYVLNSTPFVRFITSLLDLKPGRSRDVPFPSWLLNLPRELKARFLRVFFSLEAEVSLERISIVQSSRRKIEQLHYLLLSFGIYSSIRERVKWATNTAAKRGRIYYELEISGMENLRRFSEEIGIDHPKAAELFSHISERKPSGAHVHVGRFHFDYRDITSVRPQFEFGRWAGFQREVGGLYEVVRRTGFITSALSALKAKAKARAKAKVSPLQGGHAEDLLKTIEEIRAQNLTWLEVKSVKPRSYRGLLIDLSVPRLENFIGGGTAIYLHNTLSAFLAILSELVTLAERGELENRIYCAYVSPLKALGNDIRRNLHEPLEGIAELARRDLGIRVAVRTGDTSTQEKQRMLAKTPHILITTPESFAISLTSKEFSKAFHRIRWVIVDEIHALAENKRGAHLSLSLERLSERVEPVRIGLSATIHPLEEVAKFLVGRRYGRELEGLAGEGDRADPYRECVIVDARFAKGLDLGVLSPVEDFISCSAGELYGNLYELLAELVEAHRTTLIFTNTRSRTERVVYQLKERRPRLVELIGA